MKNTIGRLRGLVSPSKDLRHQQTNAVNSENGVPDLIEEEGCISKTDLEGALYTLLFDRQYYLESNPDVAEAAVDPFYHFMNFGWREGRSPSVRFNVGRYLSDNEDVSQSGLNPLDHYVRHGFLEGRKIFPDKNVLRVARSDMYEDEYRHRFGVARGARAAEYAPAPLNKPSEGGVRAKCLAFYLPQYHPFPENNRWWGEGFTEWTNVTKAVPQFTGHYQPRLPSDLGFYDLRVADVMAQQVRLAKNSGLFGFCFHYYWFDSHRLMEKPVETYLADEREEMNFPFCLCWANENWTRRWDGADEDVLIEQKHSKEDNEAVFCDLLRFFSDSRYIKVDEKPVILIYRPEIIPDIKALAQRWRSLALESGLPGLHLVATNAFGFNDYESIGFDAICEFPPHGVVADNISHEFDFLNSDYDGKVYDYGQVVESVKARWKKESAEENDRKLYPGVMVAWDNEARKPGAGNVFHNSSPALFNEWVRAAVEYTGGENDEFIFVNAWNEWAEGTYLEPDRKYGYAYLNSLSAALIDQAADINSISEACHSMSRQKASDIAIIFHCYYPDLIHEASQYFKSLSKYISFDVLVTIPVSFSSEELRLLDDQISPVRIFPVENCGRDIWPFLYGIQFANELGYLYGCKIHTKKSKHLTSGDLWRKNLLEGVLDREVVRDVVELLKDKGSIGFLAPRHTFKEVSFGADSIRASEEKLIQLMDRLGVCVPDTIKFSAGSMFWFRFAAFNKISEDLGCAEASHFGPEFGAIDGTLAHAFERVFALYVESKGYKAVGYEVPFPTFDPYDLS